MALRHEGDNLIVEGLIQHGIYPTQHDEIDQTVLLRDGHEVQGGIYAKRLKAVGTGTVHGAVLTREDIYLDERALVGGQHQAFLSGLTTPGVIRNEVSTSEVGKSVVVDFANASLRIRGPVIADTVHLTNALVAGNIHARTITLEACVVFGVIECREALVISNSNFVAYRAGRARLMGRLSTWLGYGISDDGGDFISDAARPEFEPSPAPFAAPAHVRFVPICMSGSAECGHRDDADSCNWYHGGACPSLDKIALLPVDFQIAIANKTDQDPAVKARYLRDGQETIEEISLSQLPSLVAQGVPLSGIALESREGDWKPLAEHPVFKEHRAIRRVLSVTGRILAADVIKAEVEGIHELARSIAYYPYLDEVSKKKLFSCRSCNVELKEPFTQCENPACGKPNDRLRTKGSVELFRFGTLGAEVKAESPAPESAAS